MRPCPARTIRNSPCPAMGAVSCINPIAVLAEMTISLAVYLVLGAVITGVLCFPPCLIVQNILAASPLDNIPGPKSTSIIKGNMGQLLQRFAWNFIGELGSRYQKIVKITGFFRVGGFSSITSFIGLIVVKDVDFYGLPEWNLEYGVFINPPDDNLTHSKAETCYHVAHKMRDALVVEVGHGPTTVDILNWLSRTALELVGRGVLGCSLDLLDKSGRNEYGDALKAFIPILFENSQIQYFLKYVKHIGTPAFRAAAIDWLPFPQLRRLKEIVIKMDAEARKLYYEKKHNLQLEDATPRVEQDDGNDIFTSLLHANLVASDGDHLMDDELIGQVSLLVLAGTDTTSNALV
ncbi:hypothetical protein QCA50_019331 [Cerrena zonata]|uniref:Cytochrome P450 n=1 Tax=Cerrena zonata TaxID=2478898 RepID=A0AAW0F992_9APHY